MLKRIINSSLLKNQFKSLKTPMRVKSLNPFFPKIERTFIKLSMTGGSRAKNRKKEPIKFAEKAKDNQQDIGTPKLKTVKFQKIGKIQFEKQADVKFSQLEKAFVKYKAQESRVSTVERYTEIDTDNMILGVEIDNLGEYVFRANQEEELIFVVSPISGVMKYYYLKLQNRWCNNKDNHLLDELLMRDLMTECKGYLML